MFWSKFDYFHPVFLYESILSFLNFLILIFLAKRMKQARGGLIVAGYFFNYGLIRLLTEFFRWDTAKLGDIKVAYLLSGLFMVFGFCFLRKSGIISGHDRH